MGLFRRRSFRKNKNKDVNSYQNIDLINSPDDAAAAATPPRTGFSSMTMTTTNSGSFEYPIYEHHQLPPRHQNHSQTNQSLSSTSSSASAPSEDQSDESKEATLDDLSTLINEVKSCSETYSIKPAKALRSLFALSEDEAFNEINRIRMVREANGQLIPVLLQFLQRCEPSSSEQYLVLLTLNNVSIPKENKRLVAIEHRGAFVLSRLLCQYPNIPLICIILVNLSFCDSMLRKQLVDDLYKEIQLVEAFAYALKVSLRSKEYDDTTNGNKSPQKMLEELIKNERLSKKYYNIRSVSSNSGGGVLVGMDGDDYHLSGSNQAQQPHRDGESQGNNGDIIFNLNEMTYPETARWALCGMKNLTRPPSKDSFAGHRLIQCGILPILLQTLNVKKTMRQDLENQDPVRRNIETEIICNDPYMWDNNSIQDTALYILMNLAICPSTRSILVEQDAGRVVSLIAKYSSTPTSPSAISDEEKQKDLQCLKARMVLAYLYGSNGHFGQTQATPSSKGSGDLKDHSSELLIKGSEAALLVELLANSLHLRGKPGIGGYNATTFNPKKVISAIRCLLTNKFNVKTLYVTCGVKLNALLLKSIALYSIQEISTIDSEAAEDACFSLYLLSNQGFMSPFLPPSIEGFPFYQIIHEFRKKSTSIAGKYAAKQLMLRTSYLNFQGSLFDADEPKNIETSDMELEDVLLYAAKAVIVKDKMIGSKPLDDIFGRPLTRRKRTSSQKGSENNDTGDPTGFNSALDAVQAFPLTSCDIENRLEIDDVEIANKVAMCANDDRSEVYGYKWKWEDGEIQEQEVRSKLNDFRKRKVESFRGLLKNVKNESKNFVKPYEPISFFGFKCGDFSNVVE